MIESSSSDEEEHEQLRAATNSVERQQEQQSEPEEQVPAQQHPATSASPKPYVPDPNTREEVGIPEDVKDDEASKSSDDRKWQLYWLIRRFDVEDGVSLAEAHFLWLPERRYDYNQLMSESKPQEFTRF